MWGLFLVLAGEHMRCEFRNSSGGLGGWLQAAMHVLCVHTKYDGLAEGCRQVPHRGSLPQ